MRAPSAGAPLPQVIAAAKLAGAPRAPAAGIEFLAPIGTRVEAGQPLFVLHAEAPGVLAYALDYITGQPDIITLKMDA